METLLLDMDGTLLDLRFDNHFWVQYLPRRYSEIHGVDADHAHQHVETSLRAWEGTMQWYCVDHWSDHFQVDIMALKQEVLHLVRYRDGVKEFLERLPETGVTAYLVTDAHPEVLALKQSLTGVHDNVHAAYSSHHLGAPKRHKAFWEAFGSEVSFEPGRAMMIDDSPHVLDQSRSFGIGHQLCVYQPDSGTEQEHGHEFALINDLRDLLPPRAPGPDNPA